MPRTLITAEVVAAEFARGVRRLAAPKGLAVVTPEAWSRASELGVDIDQSVDAKPAPTTGDGGSGHCEKKVDASGIVVVRGSSVELGRFEAAGAGKHVGLLDVVTAKNRSPMTGGFMSWSKADSFAWKLDYDEIDYVVEGVLHLTIDGRVLEAKSGDVVFIPKGSSVVFGTPNRVRVFYVTYPADWSQQVTSR